MENEVRLTLRLPERLHEILKQVAEGQQRSLNAQIVYLLRFAVAESNAAEVVK